MNFEFVGLRLSRYRGSLKIYRDRVIRQFLLYLSLNYIGGQCFDLGLEIVHYPEVLLDIYAICCCIH